MRSYRYPTIADVARLIRAVKADISPEFRAYEDDDKPGILLTIGADCAGSWSYQTGDTSFTGGAYSYPHWGSAAVYRNSNARDLAREIIEQIRDSEAM